MQWEPIERFDAMKRKPKNVVFFVESMKSGKSNLPAMIVTERRFGWRVVTHYFVLPEPPEGESDENTRRNKATKVGTAAT